MKRYISVFLCVCMGAWAPSRVWATVARAVIVSQTPAPAVPLGMPAMSAGAALSGSGIAAPALSLGSALPSLGAPAVLPHVPQGEGVSLRFARSGPVASARGAALTRALQAPHVERAPLSLLSRTVKGLAKPAVTAPGGRAPGKRRAAVLRSLFDGVVARSGGADAVIPGTPGKVRHPSLLRRALNPSKTRANVPMAFLGSRPANQGVRKPLLLPGVPLWVIFPAMYLFNLGTLHAIAWAVQNLEPQAVLTAVFVTLLVVVGGMFLSLIKRWNAVPFILLPVFAAMLMSMIGGAHQSPYLWAGVLTFVGTTQLYRTLSESMEPLSPAQRRKLRALFPDLSAYDEDSRRLLGAWSKQLFASKNARRRAMKAIETHHVNNPHLWQHSKAMVPLVKGVATTVYDEEFQVLAARFIGQAAFTHDEALEALRDILQAQPTSRRGFDTARNYMWEVERTRAEDKKKVVDEDLEKAVARAKTDSKFQEAEELLQNAAEAEALLQTGQDNLIKRKYLKELTRLAERLDQAVREGKPEKVAMAQQRLEKILEAVADSGAASGSKGLFGPKGRAKGGNAALPKLGPVTLGRVLWALPASAMALSLGLGASWAVAWSLDLGGVAVVHFLVLALCAFVGKGSEELTPRRWWAGLTATVTAILFFFLAGPVAHTFPGWGQTPLWISMALAGIPGGMAGLMSLSWYRDAQKPLPRSVRRIIERTKAPPGTNGFAGKELKRFTRRLSKRYEAIKSLEKHDPLRSPGLVVYVPVLSRIAELDTAKVMRQWARHILAKWGESPAMRPEIRKELARLSASKSPYVEAVDLKTVNDRLDAFEEKERSAAPDGDSAVAHVDVPAEKYEVKGLLEEAGAFLMEHKPKARPEFLARRAVEKAVARLHSAVDEGDPDAQSIAVERLRRSLRTARNLSRGMSAIFARAGKLLPRGANGAASAKGKPGAAKAKLLAFGKDLFALAIAGAVTWGAVSWIGFGGAALLVLASGIWAILVQRWSSFGTQDSAWSGWTLGVTGLMFALLMGPIGQALVPDEPLWVDLMLGGAPAGMVAMMTRRWINNNIGTVPETFKKLGLWLVSRRVLTTIGKDLVTTAAAVAAAFGLASLLGLGGALLLQLAVGIWAILVQRWSSLDTQDSRWSGWVLAVTGLLGAILVGPVGQGMASVPVWLSAVLGGVPAAPGGMMTRRWINNNLVPMPRSLKKRILNAPTTLPKADLKRLTGFLPKRYKVLQDLELWDPLSFPELAKHVPVLSLLAEWDPSPAMRAQALHLLGEWGVSPLLRPEIRKELARLMRSKSRYVTASNISWQKDKIDRFEAAERAKEKEDHPDLAAVSEPTEDGVLDGLLADAGAFVERKDLKSAPQLLRRKAVVKAVRTLEQAMAVDDRDARAVAAERLRRLLRGAAGTD